MTLLEVRSLSKRFPVGERLFFAPSRWLHAVRGVDFSVRTGSVFGFVGESGSGKSTIANLVCLPRARAAPVITWRPAGNLSIWLSAPHLLLLTNVRGVRRCATLPPCLSTCWLLA